MPRHETMRDTSNLGRCSGPARANAHARAASLPTHLNEVARHDLQLAALPQGPDLRFDLRRHAMAVNVPPGAGVFEKPLSGFAWHGAPDRLRVRPQTVNDASPVPAAPHFIPHPRAKPMQERRELCRRRQFRFRNWRRLDPAMGLGKRPRRDSATIGPRWPASLSEIAASTIVSPVPRIRMVESGAPFHARGSFHGPTNGAARCSEGSCPQQRIATSKAAVSREENRRTTEPSRSLRPTTVLRSQRRRGASVSVRRSSIRLARYRP